MKLRYLLSLFFFILLSCYVLSSCDKYKEAQSKNQLDEKIYDENANAQENIANAIEIAQQNGKHILLMFGGNWCIWCHRLHCLLMEDKVINTFLGDNYILVMIDVGKRDKNLDLNEKYRNPYQHGFPVIVVLDKTGKQLHTQETGSLEFTKSESTEKGHHTGRVLQFLKDWVPAAL